ncbi:hypothetical protein DIPPA_07994 [Diplonema papillatum]|nr:hypothetical protein DIPPA_07994 [Diplonema papillatum]
MANRAARNLLAERAREVQSFLTGQAAEEDDDGEDSAWSGSQRGGADDGGVTGAGAAEARVAPPARPRRQKPELTLVPAGRTRRVCAHYAAGACRLGACCAFTHPPSGDCGGGGGLRSPAETPSEPVETRPPAASHFSPRPALLRGTRRWFWIEKPLGYGPPCRWRCLHAGRAEAVRRAVDPVAMLANDRAYQEVEIRQVACWALLHDSGYVAFPEDVTEAIERAYVRTTSMRVGITFERCSWLVDLASLEMKCPTETEALFKLTRQPVTFKLLGAPSNVAARLVEEGRAAAEKYAVLDRYLSLCDSKTGMKLLVADQTGAYLKDASAFELPCPVDSTDFLTPPDSACPDGSDCADDGLLHMSKFLHACPLGFRCYFHVIRTTAVSASKVMLDRAVEHCARMTHEHPCTNTRVNAGHPMAVDFRLRWTSVPAVVTGDRAGGGKARDDTAGNGRSGVKRPSAVDLQACGPPSRPMTAAPRVHLDAVAAGSGEWQEVLSWLGLPDVARLERVENSGAWGAYLATRQHVGARNRGALNEKILVTPVEREDIAPIIHNGFGPGRRTVGLSAGTGPWGNGRHFFTSLAAAVRQPIEALGSEAADFHAIAAGGGSASFLFLALVSTGCSAFNDNAALLTPPERPNMAGQYFDTTTNAVEESSRSVFVAYEGNMSYPMYLVSR